MYRDVGTHVNSASCELMFTILEKTETWLHALGASVLPMEAELDMFEGRSAGMTWHRFKATWVFLAGHRQTQLTSTKQIQADLNSTCQSDIPKKAPSSSLYLLLAA